MATDNDKDKDPCRKPITFTGKRNIDKINNLTCPAVATRTHMCALTAAELTPKAQMDMLTKMYMTCDFPLQSLLKKELEQKINGYKAQDVKKEAKSEVCEMAVLITLVDTVEKLLAAKGRCFYCKTAVLLLYKNVREPTQWTLDRIDNSQGHSKDNTVIACLKCNLQRRVTPMDKFTFTKQLKINKT